MHMLIPLAVVFLSLVVSSPVNAQTAHAAPPDALEAAVQEHVGAQTMDREAILRPLARPEVQKVAGDAGIDLRRAERAASTLEGRTLTELASQARQVEETLAGGQTITFNAITIILILLLVILVIVAVS